MVDCPPSEWFAYSGSVDVDIPIPLSPFCKSCERKENGGWGKLSWPCWSGRQTSQLPSLSNNLLRLSSLPFPIFPPRLGRNIHGFNWFSQYQLQITVTFLP